MIDFVVDDAQLGTSEREWMSSPYLNDLAPLRTLHPRRVIVLAPHPDDEILGVGGLLQAFISRRVPVEIIAVTDGEASHAHLEDAECSALRSIRARESTEALKRIGLPDPVIRRLALPDGRVQEHLDQLCDALDEAILADDLCVAPWRHDGHPDHDACGEAAIHVAQAKGADHLAYLIWAWHWVDPTTDDGGPPWADCRRFDLTRSMTARKRWATGAFLSQTRRADDHSAPVLPPSVLRRFWRPFETFIDEAAP